MSQKREVRAIPRFEKSLKRLAKHFPKVKRELAKIAIQLEAGDLLGDKVPHASYDVYKVRLANPDAQKGKSGGFRVIYYLKTQEFILLINIYSKSEQTDMPPSEIAEWIKEYEAADLDEATDE
jgi:mRNA-degrading endonuclease RelE of RelBE toxin-antitoxin system